MARRIRAMHENLAAVNSTQPPGDMPVPRYFVADGKVSWFHVDVSRGTGP